MGMKTDLPICKSSRKLGESKLLNDLTDRLKSFLDMNLTVQIIFPTISPPGQFTSLGILTDSPLCLGHTEGKHLSPVHLHKRLVLRDDSDLHVSKMTPK